MSSDDSQVLLDGCTALLNVVFGESNWYRWNEIKQQTEHSSLQDFLSWMLDLAQQELTNNLCEETYAPRPSNTGASVYSGGEMYVQPEVKVAGAAATDAAVVDITEDALPHMPADIPEATDASRGIQMTYVPEKSSFFCQACSVSLSDMEVVQEHMRLRHVSLPLTLTCYCCQQTFSTVHHYVTYHKANATLRGNTKGLVCDYCAKGFRARADLESHIANKHLKTGPRYECVTCGKKFSYIQSLNKHKKTCGVLVQAICP